MPIHSPIPLGLEWKDEQLGRHRPETATGEHAPDLVARIRDEHARRQS